jgi:hypothetical protein
MRSAFTTGRPLPSSGGPNVARWSAPGSLCRSPRLGRQERSAHGAKSSLADAPALTDASFGPAAASQRSGSPDSSGGSGSGNGTERDLTARHRIVRATGVRAQQQHRSGRDVSTRYRYETGFHGAGRKCCHGGVSEHRSGLRRSGPDLRRAAFRTGCRRPGGRMGRHAPRGAHKIVEPRRAARLP